MFVVFYTVNLYICILMTYSTSYFLYDTLMDPWNVCVYENVENRFGGSLLHVQIVLSECYKIKFWVYQQLTDSDSSFFWDKFLYMVCIFIGFVCCRMSRVLEIFNRGYSAFDLKNHSRSCIPPILCCPKAFFQHSECFHILKQNFVQKCCLLSLSFYRLSELQIRQHTCA